MIALNENPPEAPNKNRIRFSLPEQVASVKDVERVYGISSKLCKIIRETGKYPEAFDRSGRVNILPLLKAIDDLFKKLPRALLVEKAGLNGFAELDKNDIQARVAAQEEIARIRENALANGELVTRSEVQKELAGPLDMIASAWKNYGKTHGQKIKSFLAGAGLPPEQIQIVLDMAIDGVEAPLRTIREQLVKENKS